MTTTEIPTPERAALLYALSHSDSTVLDPEAFLCWCASVWGNHLLLRAVLDGGALPLWGQDSPPPRFVLTGDVLHGEAFRRYQQRLRQILRESLEPGSLSVR